MYLFQSLSPLSPQLQFQWFVLISLLPVWRRVRTWPCVVSSMDSLVPLLCSLLMVVPSPRVRGYMPTLYSEPSMMRWVRMLAKSLSRNYRNFVAIKWVMLKQVQNIAWAAWGQSDARQKRRPVPRSEHVWAESYCRLQCQYCMSSYIDCQGKLTALYTADLAMACASFLRFWIPW